jgi:hypothetical protein
MRERVRKKRENESKMRKRVNKMMENDRKMGQYFYANPGL